ncbi:MAG: LLM class flavin-dependent oxidoreductase [Nitrososphaerota archaeon]|nr:LLM class flavin-dependent oxidoreductase [Nitrososphaerota archaeon]
MKFGVRLPNSGPLANRANMIQVADEAERLGFHSIWVHDHILWGTEQHRTHLSAGSAEALDESQRPNFYESITTLSYLAGRTRKVKVGIAVLVLPLRNPVVVAKQLANLDVMSEGRLILGVAPGAPNITRSEFEAVGVPYEERGKVTDEYMTSIRKIWTENLPSFSGRYVNFKEAQMFPKPTQRNLMILVGGGERGISPRALRRVIELGDGWIPAYLTPEEVSEGVASIRKAATASGKDPSKYFVSHEMFTSVNADSQSAARAAAKSLSSNFVSVEEGLKRSLVGNPRELREKLQLYEKAGVNLTELKFVYSSISEFLEMMKLFAGEALSSFE